MILLIWGMTLWKDLGIDDWHDSWNCNQSCGFQGCWGIMEKGLRQEPASKPLKKPSDTSLASGILMFPLLGEPLAVPSDDKLFTHIPHWFAISEYMKYVKQDLLFFRAPVITDGVLCIFTYLKEDLLKLVCLYQPGNYHTNQRWRLPQLPRSDSQLPKTLWCCSWYWVFNNSEGSHFKLGILEGSPTNYLL